MFILFQNGDGPLHLACQTGNLDIVENLVAHGVDLNILNSVRILNKIHIVKTAFYSTKRIFV